MEEKLCLFYKNNKPVPLLEFRGIDKECIKALLVHKPTRTEAERINTEVQTRIYLLRRPLEVLR